MAVRDGGTGRAGVPRGDQHVPFGGIDADHRGPQTRDGLRDEACPATDVDDPHIPVNGRTALGWRPSRTGKRSHSCVTRTRLKAWITLNAPSGFHHSSASASKRAISAGSAVPEA